MQGHFVPGREVVLFTSLADVEADVAGVRWKVLRIVNYFVFIHATMRTAWERFSQFQCILRTRGDSTVTTLCIDFKRNSKLFYSLTLLDHFLLHHINMARD